MSAAHRAAFARHAEYVDRSRTTADRRVIDNFGLMGPLSNSSSCRAT
jgi:hypothetical protein